MRCALGLGIILVANGESVGKSVEVGFDRQKMRITSKRHKSKHFEFPAKNQHEGDLKKFLS